MLKVRYHLPFTAEASSHQYEEAPAGVSMMTIPPA
jgi:hypothetical protein